MLQPKKSKYRKQFRGKRGGVSPRGFSLSFGDYGLKSLSRGWMTANQIEAARRALAHHTKREGKIWIRVFSDKPITKKAAGVRMGSGKGEIDKYVAVIKPGRILFEMAGVSEKIALESMKLAAAKLPFKTKIIKKE
jgi:large subunit ribosomal protein L16